MNILVTAYACEPYRGSEAGTAWNIVTRLAEEHEVTVLTRANNQGVIDGYLAKKPLPKLRFVYVDPPGWSIRLKKAGWLPVQVFYFLWQLAVAWEMFTELKRLRFDIYHHITFNSFEVPPFSSLFIGDTPFVWGPVGGGQTVSPAMLHWFGGKGRLIEIMRNLRVWASGYNPLCILVLKRAQLVYFANHETETRLARWCGGSSRLMIDVGVDIDKFATVQQSHTNRHGKVSILFAGSLEPRKGVELLLNALGLLKGRGDGYSCKIVGDGPDRKRLETLSGELGLSRSVCFPGRVSHDEMAEVFGEADIFVFPSLRDTSGAIVLEAMAMEKPTICIDHQGAAIMVSDKCGLKVTPGSAAGTAASFAEALDTLMEDANLRERLGSEARKRVAEEYDWRVRVDRTVRDYCGLVE